MLKIVTTLAAKDLKLLMRDRLALFFVLGIPVIYGIFFGVINGAFRSGDVRLNIAVVDEDQSRWSNRYLQLLREQMPEARWVTGTSRAAAVDLCRKGSVTGAVVLPKGFGERAGIFFQNPPEIDLAVDPSRSAEQGLLQGQLMQAMGQLSAVRMQDAESMRAALDSSIEQIRTSEDMPPALRPALIAALQSFRGFFDQLDTLDNAGDSTDEAQSPQFEFVKFNKLPITRQRRSPNGAPLDNIQTAWDVSFPQAMIWGMLGCASTFAASLVRERRTGSLVRLQVAPLGPRVIMLGKAAACFFSVTLVIVVMLLLGLALGMRPRQPMILLPATLASAFCFTGVMTCMATLGKSEEAVSGASWGINIMMAMFGGGMIPLAFMPGWMQTVSHVDPVKWSILAVEGGIWRDFSWQEAMGPLAILCAVGAFGVFLGARLFSRQY